MKASTIRSLSLVLALGALAACKSTQVGSDAEVKTFDDADDMRQSAVDSNYWIVNCKNGISEIRHKSELAAQKFCESITIRQFYSPDRKESWYTANPSSVGPSYGDRGVRFNALKYPMTNEAGQPLTQELTHCYNVQQKDHLWGHPGKKLLFMGGEFGQRREWNHDSELDWSLLGSNHNRHDGLQRWVADLNRLYRAEPALHAIDFEAAGFEWVDGADSECCVLIYLRKSGVGEVLLVAANFTPVPRENYLVGVPKAGRWRELLNSDAPLYGGSGVGNRGGVGSVPVAAHGRFQSLNLTLPPLGIVFLKHAGEAA